MLKQEGITMSVPAVGAELQDARKEMSDFRWRPRTLSNDRLENPRLTEEFDL